MDEELQNEEEIETIDANLDPGGDGEVQLAKVSNPVPSAKGGSASGGKEKKLELEKEEKDQGEFYDEGEGQLTVDLYQTPDEIILESPIAGVKPEDLDISITSESVTVKGQRQKESKIKDEDYFYQECYWGRFSRSIILPQEVDAEKAEASVKNGVLIITLPKLNRQRSKKIRVQSS